MPGNFANTYFANQLAFRNAISLQQVQGVVTLSFTDDSSPGHFFVVVNMNEFIANSINTVSFSNDLNSVYNVAGIDSSIEYNAEIQSRGNLVFKFAGTLPEDQPTGFILLGNPV